MADLPEAFADAMALLSERLCLHQAALAPLLASILPVLAVVDRERLVAQVLTAFAVQFDGMLERYADQLHPRLSDPARRRLACTVVVHAVRGALNTLTLQDPDALRDPALHEEIASLLVGLAGAR